MRVLAVYAHPNRKSFCHAVLEQFTTGLRDGGHSVEVVDLYAIKFDPVFRNRDMATYLHENIPPEILESMNLKQTVLENVPGGPVGRFVASRWMRGKTPQQIAKFIREHAPKDAREQWAKDLLLRFGADPNLDDNAFHAPPSGWAGDRWVELVQQALTGSCARTGGWV